MADTPTGETVTPEAPSNNVTATATPGVNAIDTAEVERLRREADQARMRANQLQNQLDEQKKKEEADKLKQLEDNNEYKTLYEQAQAKLEETDRQRQAEEKQKEIKSVQDKLLEGYSDEVKQLAQEAGMGLTEPSDDAVAALKAKLDKISTMVSSKGVGPNNPLTNNSKPKLTGDELKVALRDNDKFAEIAMDMLPSVKNWRTR